MAQYSIKLLKCLLKRDRNVCSLLLFLVSSDYQDDLREGSKRERCIQATTTGWYRLSPSLSGLVSVAAPLRHECRPSCRMRVLVEAENKRLDCAAVLVTASGDAANSVTNSSEVMRLKQKPPSMPIPN